MNQEEIEKRFTYHGPRPGQVQRYTYIRDWTKWLAEHICSLTPESHEQSLAITALEECVFWANAAIARNETTPEQIALGQAMTMYRDASEPESSSS